MWRVSDLSVCLLWYFSEINIRSVTEGNLNCFKFLIQHVKHLVITFDAHTTTITASKHHTSKGFLASISLVFLMKLSISLKFLALKVLVTTVDAQREGMGDVGSARYEPALLPPCPTIRVLSYSN